MSNQIDTILADYSAAAARPGGTRLEEWVLRYPQHERALVRFAVYQHVTQAMPMGRETEVLEERAEYSLTTAKARFLERARAIREQMQAEQGRSPLTTHHSPLTSLLDAAKALGLSAAALAQRLEVGPAVIAKLHRRHFRPESLPRRLVNDLAEALRRPMADVAAYLRQPPTLAAQASYKADQAPHLTGQEEFAAALAASRDMTDAQKARWQAELDDLLGEAE